jgi:hypothetical protein
MRFEIKKVRPRGSGWRSGCAESTTGPSRRPNRRFSTGRWLGLAVSAPVESSRTGYTHTPASTSAKSVRLDRSTLDTERSSRIATACWMLEQRAANRTRARHPSEVRRPGAGKRRVGTLLRTAVRPKQRLSLRQRQPASSPRPLSLCVFI